MDPRLQFIINKILNENKLTASEKESYIKSLEETDATLQIKDRELEIESSLEQVRTVALSMRKPKDMLEVCKIISQQLELLGVREIRNVQTAIFYEEKGTYANYEFYARHNKQMVTDVGYKNHPISQTFADQMLKGANQVWTHAFKGEEIRDWLNYQKSTNVFIDTYLETADTLNYYWYSLGPVALGISAYAPLNEEEINLFKRFRNVFELAYRRYLDIEKAEAQTRESQIQLALERVRARTMAMQKSEELTEVAALLFKQVNDLGIKTWTTGFNVWSEDNNSYVDYVTNPKGEFIKPYTVQTSASRMGAELCQARKSGDEFFVQYAEGEKLRENYLALTSAATSQFEKILESGFQFPSHQYNHFVFGTKASLLFITYDPIPEAHDIFKRLGKVFEQTYTRFLDLQRAEEQTREAQIEAALERVRSRTMAMHKSEDLSPVTAELFKELSKFGGKIGTCGFVLCDRNKTEDEYWVCWETGIQPPMLIPHTTDPTCINLYKAWEEGKEFYAEEKSGEELKAHFDYMLTVPSARPVFENWLRMEGSFPIWQRWHAAYFKYGFVFVITAQPYPEEQIFKRFAPVFGQAYTRFLDLQRAEAQAKEAKIEAALEKVRSSSLAMHYSDELEKVVVALFDKLLELDILFDGAFIFVFEKEKRHIHLWVASKINPPVKVNLPYDADIADNPIIEDLWSSIEKKEDIFNRAYSGKVKNDYYRYVGKNNQFNIPESIKEMMLEAESWTVCFAAEKNSIVGIDSWSGHITTEEDFQILKRFARVFDQAYIRFLDLQKAEEQAKEAQIELSLERLRAKTMAMHNSEDVGETVATMFAEFVHLGIHTNRCGILIYHDEQVAEVWTARSTQDGNAKLIIGNLDLDAHQLLRSGYNAWKAKEAFHQYDLLGEDMVRYYTAINDSKFYPTQFDLTTLPSEEFHSDFFFSDGALFSFTNEPVAEEHTKIIKRFASVFGQTYRRYLDLQKAEAQAREAKIEAALEKVRSRSIAMHHSDELEQVVASLFDRLVELGISLDGALIFLFDKEKRHIHLWIATTHLSAPAKIDLPYDEEIKNNPIIKDLWNAIENGEHIFNKSYSKETKNDYFRYVSKYNESKIPESVRNLQIERDNWTVYFVAEKNSLIGFDSWTGPIAGDEYFPILTRFSKVFEQAYTRFLDLKKAEAQAREAQIQLALERVRARTMAMQKSDELREVVAVTYEQLLQLGFVREGSCNINIMDAGTGDVDWWMTGFGNQKYPHKFHVQYINHPVHITQLEVWKTGEKYTSIEVAGESKKEFDKLMLSQKDFEKMSEETKMMIASLDRVVFSMAFMKYGALSWAANPITDEQANILQRFAGVFEQTYTRFLDLQNAEAQAREAQIELALERVRARAMAMQNSNELSELVAILFDELVKLDLILARCIIWIFDNETLSARVWMANSEDKRIANSYYIKPLEHPYYKAVIKAWKEKIPKWTYELSGSNKKSIDDLLLNDTDLSKLPETVKSGIRSSQHTIISGSFNNFGFIEASGPLAHTEEQLDILSRFSKVFDLSYTRFNDLQKAESQAREATIEAALERVRSKAMSMYNSQDISATAGVVFAELDKLGIKPIRSGVGLVSREDRKMQLYSMASSADGKNLSLMGEIALSGHPVFDKQYEFWLRKENYFVTLKGDELRSYYDILSSKLNTRLDIGYQSNEEQFAYWIMFSEGFFYTWSEKKYSDAEINILERFKNVIELTFRRYIDLKKSEANAKEAVKQAALDRIRADIASMRTIKDLDRITPLIWKELTILGIPFIRCGVFLMDEGQSLIHTFLSEPDGQAIAAFKLPYNASEKIKELVKRWHDKKNYIDHWGEKDFSEFAGIIVKQGSFTSPEEYIKTIPQGGFYLHFSPFLQGMLYVGNTTQLNEEEIKLIQSVAEAFSTAYARYEDFNNLEAAKRQVDKTLVDLRQAQAQLVQSEKMASLGELTAGIAHEIQNPLNFVNNFSDVNSELLKEMKNEIDKGNFNEARLIADDIIDNEEKIIHHGKRADSIVKGMLQHSRSSTGQKEPTDINALADEYLRLSYHGLRAKDGSFNAIMKTDFDPSIGKINIVPQDIGRVLLNIFNNAFYAVSEKKKSTPRPTEGGVSYEPCITVITKAVKPPSGGSGVLISVQDNGNGIPQKILDKIFQPFFTTKPSGQGTGLGLSLSYDIIKAHGGEIKIETSEGNGSEFKILLPLLN
ncbi:MAG TPA: ATP-binding protein [Puia sp.]|nr:ATP-binding protein [Puia sp.]